MRIVCPACQATYEVPDQLIGAGRSLRCKACRHAWWVAPPGAPPAAESPAPPAAAPSPAEPPPPPETRPMPPPVPAARPRIPQPIDPPLPHPEDVPLRSALALRAAWAASILAVGALLFLLWLYRVEIVAAWPPAARLFLLFGGPAQG